MAEAVEGCPTWLGRRDYLKEQFSLLTHNPDAYVTTTGTLRTRRSQLLWSPVMSTLWSAGPSISVTLPGTRR